MHILPRGVLVFVFTSLMCTACSDTVSSVSLTLPADMQEPLYAVSSVVSERPIRSIPLKALNKNAQAGIISNPKKSDVMYFAFEQSPEMLGLTGSGLYALELEFEPLAPAAKSSGTVSIITSPTQTNSTEFAVGLLYASNFSASGKLKGAVLPQHPVTAQVLPHATFTVSIGFAGAAVPQTDTRGFMVSSQAPLKLNRAAIVPVQYGWLKKGSAGLWYGAAADGGSIPPELCTDTGIPVRTELPKPSAVIRTKNTEPEGRDNIIIHFGEALPIALTEEQQQPRLSFQCGGKRLSVYRAPNVYRLTLDGCLFPDAVFSIEQTNEHPYAEKLSDADILPDTSGQADTAGADNTADTAMMVCGITAEYDTPPLLSPITADPGIILQWSQAQWRQPSYELFAWEQFPSVLIFDFSDHAVQDAYLNRLSFFAEKKGFTGKLLFDKDIASLHGFNAHDYRAETLAAFFQKAEEEAFPLNTSELHLRKILFHNGIIVRTETGIETGNGAIVSISRQSPAYLRYRFITHECLHGIYFTEESFRNTVTKVFRQTDSRAVLFLRRYFEVYPALQYNTDDDYLLQNEFMAYLLQQGSDSLQQYYNRISWFRAINQAEPALCRYIRNTNAKAFVHAAAQMSSFLYAAWGLKGGRIHLAEIDSL